MEKSVEKKVSSAVYPGLKSEFLRPKTFKTPHSGLEMQKTGINSIFFVHHIFSNPIQGYGKI
jgi:hypothetical protein